MAIPASMRRSPDWETVGGLSNPGKMPCSSTSTPANACITGSKLAAQDGTVCSGCYALKGNYRFGNVQKALRRRLDALGDPDWIHAMARLVSRVESPETGGSGFFRWHDSGDLQSLKHLRAICAVARATPTVRHWLPTREYKFVRALKRDEVPSNLTIRVSAHKLDSRAPDFGLPMSEVVTDGTENCEAYTRKGKCGPCRACWDPSVPVIRYPKH